MLTIAQISKIAKKHKYLGLRYSSGHLLGINSGCIRKAALRSRKHPNSNSEFISVKPLNINEYINCKCAFV